MFAFQNLPSADAGVGSTPTACSPSPVAWPRRPFRVDNGTAKFDLTLYLSPTPVGMDAAWQYNADLFEAATIERLARQFEALLAAIASGPATGGCRSCRRRSSRSGNRLCRA